MPAEKPSQAKPQPPNMRFFIALLGVMTAALCLASAEFQNKMAVIAGALAFLFLAWLGVYEITLRRAKSVERALRDMENRFSELESRLLGELAGKVEEMNKRQREDLAKLWDGFAEREKIRDTTMEMVNHRLNIIADAINNVKSDSKTGMSEIKALADSIYLKSEHIAPTASLARQIAKTSESLLVWAQNQQNADEALKIRNAPSLAPPSESPPAWSPEAFEAQVLQKVEKTVRETISQELAPLLASMKALGRGSASAERAPLAPASASPNALQTWGRLMEDAELGRAAQSQSAEWWRGAGHAYEFFRSRWSEMLQVKPSEWGKVDVELLDKALYFEWETPLSLPAEFAERFGRLQESIKQVQEDHRRQLAQRGVSRIEQEAKRTSAGGEIRGRVEADANELQRPHPPSENLEFKFYKIAPGKGGYEFEGKVIADKPTQALYYRRYDPLHAKGKEG